MINLNTKKIVVNLSIVCLNICYLHNVYADLISDSPKIDLFKSLRQNTTTNNEIVEENIKKPINFPKENISIAVVDFRNEQSFRQKITSMIKGDLAKTGQFKFVDTVGIMPIPYESKQVIFPDWRNRKADYLIIGKIVPIDLKSNRFEVQFRLFNTEKQQQIAGLAVTLSANQFREYSHKFSDLAYHAITGQKNIFSSKISYIQKENNLYSLFIADSDGLNPQRIITSTKPLLSPSWSPDGNKIAYVSYELGRPLVYVQSLSTGQRVLINFEDGANSAPSWSPDGKKLAFVISKNGASNIYTINANGTNLRPLTQESSINTEPSWSPDGQQIIFTSDRDGSPQIFSMSSVDGSNVSRLNPRDVNYAVGGQMSSDGSLITYVRKTSENSRQAIIQNLNNNTLHSISENNQDESPRFSANGKILMFSSKINGYQILAINSLDGRQKQKLFLPKAELFSPNWSGYLQ